MNRRAFLKLLSIAKAGLASDTSQAVFARNDVYVNRHLGIAFQAPPSWHFYTVHDMNQIHDAQLPRAADSVVAELVSELKSQPLVALGERPITDERSGAVAFSPSIVVRLELNEDNWSLADVISRSNLLLSRITTGYQEKRTEFTRVCGYPAALGTYRYLFEAEKMAGTPIIGRSCIIDVGRYLYSINMYNHDPEKPKITQYLDDFVDSIQLL